METVKAINEANVTITIKGLAMFNYNANSRNWETIFLRHIRNHDLKIILNKYRSGQLEDSRSYDIEPDEKIYIRSNKAEEFPTKYETDDDKNLNHIMDFATDGLHNGKVVFKKDLNFPKTFLSISDSIFYTKTLSRNTYRISKGEELLKIAQVGLAAGADIVCRPEGKTEIILSSQPNLIPALVAEPDVIYEIIFDNDCAEPESLHEPDFFRYYDFLEADQKISMIIFGDDWDEKDPPCSIWKVSQLEEGMNSLSELCGKNDRFYKQISKSAK